MAELEKAASEDAAHALRSIDSCTISDACDALGVDAARGWLPPVWEGASVCGVARTTALEPVNPASPPVAKVHLGSRAIERAEPGDVIVVSNGGRIDMGAWGGLLSRAASIARVGGVVVDGACRDVDEARDLAFPVFALAGALLTARGRVHEVSSGEPVRLFGTTVREGDLVKADGSGVVVVPAESVRAVAGKATAIVERERLMIRGLEEGESVSLVMGRDYEDMLRD